MFEYLESQTVTLYEVFKVLVLISLIIVYVSIKRYRDRNKKISCVIKFIYSHMDTGASNGVKSTYLEITQTEFDFIQSILNSKFNQSTIESIIKHFLNQSCSYEEHSCDDIFKYIENNRFKLTKIKSVKV